jgi:hypothetical protein
MNNTGIFFIWFDSNFDFKKFEKEIVFESSVLAWIRSRVRIRIRIELKCWIRIRIESIRIHNPVIDRYRYYSYVYGTGTLFLKGTKL